MIKNYYRYTMFRDQNNLYDTKISLTTDHT